MNIIGSTINNNRALYVRQLAIRIFSNLLPLPQWRFLIWKSTLRCPIWQGGGVYIRGSSTVVTITLTSIYQNTASYVSFLPVSNRGPTTTPQWRFLIWKSILCCQIWQGLGGGVYIDGSSTVVAITLTIIYQNEASGVSFLPVLNQGPTTTPR